ncbi:recombinase family protein, partial [Ruminococcus flavefaciens]|uniref:recombinase family protein n=1 Tax=Ruminococcus flavefaciens TaxID=1265 RepID=UPI0026F2F8AB
KDQQFQRRRPPTCGTKKFKATISSRCLIYAYFRFWVFYDCTFLDNSKENIDTDTPTGKFMLTVFAALSQLEREQLKQRQREGIEIAKAQGKYTGRKPIPTDWTRFEQLYGEWRAKHITGRDFMRRMDMSANTFYRRVREYELRHGITEQTSA